MSTLAGLKNDSGQEDSPSREEQAPLQRVADPKDAGKHQKTDTKLPVKRSTTPDTAPPLLSAESTKDDMALPSDENRSESHKSLDESRKRKLLLIPKPVSGVENWGVPAEPTTECLPERAEKIAHFLSLHESGHRLNDHLQSNKALRNPRIYAKFVEFVEVDEFGSNFPKEVFDPHGFPSSAYIGNVKKRQEEEREAALQNRTHIPFVGSSTSTSTSTSNNSTVAAAIEKASRLAKSVQRSPPPRQSNSSKKRDSRRRGDRPSMKKYL